MADADVVALPPSGDGSRRRARTTSRKRRGGMPRIGWIAAIVVVVAALVAAFVWQWPRSTNGDSFPKTLGSFPALGPPRADLVVQRGAGGAVVDLALLVVRPPRLGGTVVRIPVRTMAEVPTLGLVTLEEAAAKGGLAALRQAIENILGRPFDEVAELATGQVPAIELPRDASVGQWQGAWEAWLASLSGPPALPIGADLVLLAGATPAFRLLPVDTLGGQPPLFQVRAGELDQLVAELLPGTPVSKDRARVQVLNGAGRAGVSQEVQPLLVAIGARVTLTGNADRFDYEATRIVYYDGGDEAAARRVRDALGVGTLERSSIALDAVDVTVVVGRDFVARLAGTTTSTSKGA